MFQSGVSEFDWREITVRGKEKKKEKRPETASTHEKRDRRESIVVIMEESV